jgi:hypothetical protein
VAWQDHRAHPGNARTRASARKATKHLTPTEKSAAKARAARAGRAYPNLVDNMAVAAKKGAKTKTSGRKRKASKKTAKSSNARSTSKRTARKSSGSVRKQASRKRTAREQDPRGGLTAAGRKAFAQRDGAHLKSGVTKPMAEMTLQEMRRKGSWAVRFYGREKLPPLLTADGQPTRHALSAQAWGEPVPRTVAAARRIAAKGERLLARYRRLKDQRG